MDKFPLLFQHGYGSHASYAANAGTFNQAFTLRLVDEGYDVWFGNNRGVPYSNEHDRDGEWSLEERWNFTYAEMGVYDMPAQINKVLEVTNKSKVTVLGYSQGSAQMLYGLAKMQEYFAERVNRSIALAPCLADDYFTPYPDIAYVFKQRQDKGEIFAPYRGLSSVDFSFAKPEIDCAKSKNKKDCHYEPGFSLQA